MNDLRRVSQEDAYCLLTAYSRLNSSDVTDLCSHSHEKDFLCRNNDSLLTIVREKNTCVILTLSTSVVNISIPFLHGHVGEFLKEIKNKHHSECLLWCASLLIDFHKKDECSDYMTSALKFKLLAYDCVAFFYYVEAEKTTSCLMEFLRYISVNKFKHSLFLASIDQFSQFLPSDYLDPLHGVLPEIFEEAKSIRFDFFTCCDPFLLQYKRRSLFHNLRRFLCLLNYGYEDRYYKGAIRDYLKYIHSTDREDLFGFKNRSVCKKKAHKKYRCYQVLVLYIKKFYDTEDPWFDYYDKALHMHWSSIADPFITQRQFFSSFEHSRTFPEFSSVWKWYENVVLDGKVSPTSPRSLLQLSRCVIRRRLTKCFQMPCGIESFDISQILKNYLTLKY